MPFQVQAKPKGAKDAKPVTIEVGAGGDVTDQKSAEAHVAKACGKDLEVIPSVPAEAAPE